MVSCRSYVKIVFFGQDIQLDQHGRSRFGRASHRNSFPGVAQVRRRLFSRRDVAVQLSVGRMPGIDRRRRRIAFKWDDVARFRHGLGLSGALKGECRARRRNRRGSDNCRQGKRHGFPILIFLAFG